MTFSQIFGIVGIVILLIYWRICHKIAKDSSDRRAVHFIYGIMIFIIIIMVVSEF